MLHQDCLGNCNFVTTASSASFQREVLIVVCSVKLVSRKHYSQCIHGSVYAYMKIPLRGAQNNPSSPVTIVCLFV